MKGDKRLDISLFLLVIAPIVVAVVILIVGRRWYPAGDMAQAELHMRGFFHRPPLVGAAGRIVSDSGFQGSHPGPSLWFAMLPAYLLGGRSSDALMAAAASVHLVSIAAILWLVHRRSGRAMTVATAIALLAVLRSAGTDFMIEPWNPWLALLPFAVFVMLVLEVVSPSGALIHDWKWQRAHLISAVVVGSHCVQSHAGYVLLVIPPLMVCLGILIHRTRHPSIQSPTSTRGVTIRPIVWGVGAALPMWLLPLVDQVRRKPGNMTILIQHFGSPEEPTLALSKVADIVVSQLNILGPWILGPGVQLSPVVEWIGFGAFVLIVGTAIRASTNPSQRASLIVLVGFMGLGVFSIFRIFGPYFEYTVRWFWLLAGFSLSWSVTILGKRMTLRSRFLSFRMPMSSVVSLGVVFVLCSVTIWQVVERVKMPGATDSRILAGLIDETVAELDKDKTYQVRFYDPYTLNATGFGLVLELERQGFTAKVDPQFAAAALPHRTALQQDTDEVLWVVVGPALENALNDPELRVLAAYNPRSVQEQERARNLLVEVERGLRDAGREELIASLDTPGASILFADPPLPEETAELVRELIRMGQPTGVFAMAVSTVATSLR